MSLEERKYELNAIYNELIAAGAVSNLKDFAKILQSNYNCLTQAMNGSERYCTKSLVNKARYVKNQTLHQELSMQTNDELSERNTISALAPIPQSMKLVPTIPIHAYRAVNFDIMEYFNTTNDELRMSPIIMQFPGTDCYYFVNSEDMSPHLRTNDLLCLSRLPDGARVTNGDICIINTKTQGLLERFVYDDGDALLVKSSQPRWTDMRIPKDEIFNIFRILGGIRTNI